MPDNDYFLDKELKISQAYNQKLNKDIINNKQQFIKELKSGLGEDIKKEPFPIIKKLSFWSKFKKAFKGFFTKL